MADIYTIEGRLVTNIYAGFLPKNTHTLTWTPDSNERGIFICKIRFEGREYFGKIIKN